MSSISTIKFKNYKSFTSFSVTLTDFNILVGPNNAGKSTVIGSIKLLSEGIRRAKLRRPTSIYDCEGILIDGYEIDLKQVPIPTENVFHNYDDSIPAEIVFILSNGYKISFVFTDRDRCYMQIDGDTPIKSPKDYLEFIGVTVGFVPILGPVDHHEHLYQQKAARSALLSYRASRNFRNIWFHYSEDFPEFQEMVRTTWPGMDINRPEADYSQDEPMLNMFCPEERIPREIFWAGYGFQVWCQMLTYIIKNKNSTIFLIDEPDIYLHSDLQRQLLGILKGLGPDIIIATHSTEIICEAETNDILLINKASKTAKRIKDQAQLKEIFGVLGSNLNPVLTQIAKTNRIVFVEGKDFLIFSKLARILKLESVANRSDFAVVPVEGFNPTRLRAFKEGIEKTIGSKVLTAVIFDKDYRSNEEIIEVKSDLEHGHVFAHIHSFKELENILLIPEAIIGAVEVRLSEINKRKNQKRKIDLDLEFLITDIANSFKNRTQSQLHAHRLKYEKSKNSKIDEATILQKSLDEFDKDWEQLSERLKMVPGKEFISVLNQKLQEQLSLTITHTNIIKSMNTAMIPKEIIDLLKEIETFRKKAVE